MEGGYEYNLILGLGAAALSIRGPGRYSIDRLLNDRLNRPWIAAVSLAVFGAASAVVVSQRQRALAAPDTSAAPDQSAASDQVSEGERAQTHGD
jgi:putative oxidoreductase